jgi:hypothetical protein
VGVFHPTRLTSKSVSAANYPGAERTYRRPCKDVDFDVIVDILDIPQDGENMRRYIVDAEVGERCVATCIIQTIFCIEVLDSDWRE